VTFVDGPLLDRLVGARMHSVQFVLDYLQLHFEIGSDGEDSPLAADAPILTCNAWPTVEVEGDRFERQTTGWADALLSLVGQRVVAAHEAPSGGLRVDLDTGSLVLRPTDAELVGPEIALLQGFADRQWDVWVPGERAFGYL
jgi:hypothetical protein